MFYQTNESIKVNNFKIVIKKKKIKIPFDNLMSVLSPNKQSIL